MIMTDRTYRRDRYGRDQYDRDRGFSRQEEQFDATDYSWRDDERSFGQMGDDFGRYESGQPYNRDNTLTGRSFGGGGYGMRSYRARENGPRETRDYRDTFSRGAGSQLAANHGEWRDEDSWRSAGNERGWFERAGDEVAAWFGDPDARRRREMDDHTGHGPAGYTRSDERILEDACDELTDDWGVDARQIQVTVANGDVTLEGTVPSREQKRRAEDCVEDVSGVRNVQNNLRVEERSRSEIDRGTTGAI
jgi:osmotically-inducible protein OsmY